MIKIVKKDLLSVTRDCIIGHQVNAKGVMGSGVAQQIRKAYPVVYDEYKALYDSHIKQGLTRESLLGKVQGVSIGNGLYVANMFGQLNYGNDGKQYTDTEALYSCFKRVRAVSEESGLPVYLPYCIGCFRGGADWGEVENLLLIAFEGHEVTLCKL